MHLISIILLFAFFFPMLIVHAAGPTALIPPTPNITPSWSPDGQYIAYIQMNAPSLPELWLFGLERGVKGKLLNRRMRNPEILSLDQVFAWAPDGKSLLLIANNINVAAVNRSLFVVGLNGQSQCLTLQNRVPHNEVVSAAWSRDGNSIAYIAKAEKEMMLAVIDRDGKNWQELSRGAFEGAPAWTADGKSLIVTKAGETRMTDLWLIAVADGAARNLTNTPYKPERQPTVSSDGTMLAFTGDISAVTGNMIATDVFVTPLAAFAPEEIITLSDTPRWRPDGKALAVRTSDDVHQPVRYQIIDLHGNVIKTVPAGYFPSQYTSGISFAPDSKRFIYEKDGTIWLDTLE